MRKIRICIVLFILSFCLSAKAEVMFEIDCNNKKDISSNNSLVCYGNLSYELVTINDIELEYDTNLSVNFKETDGFSLSKSGNKIKVHSKTPLYEEIMDSRVIFEIVLSSNENSKDTEKLTFKNIKINNSTDEIIEDASETFNILNVKKELDNVCTLDSITVDKVKIDNYDKNKLEYSISTTNESVFIDAVRTSNKSSAEGLGYVLVPNGESIVREILVTAENGDTKVYKLHMTNTSSKKKEISSDSTLKLLDLYYNKEKIDFNFNKNEKKFNIKVDSKVDKLKIVAETTDANAKFDKKYGPREVKINYGDNKYELKVYAENFTFTVYTLVINRPDERDSDNTLKSLKINGKEVNIDKDTTKYEISLTNEELKTEIEAIANSSKAKVDYKDIDLLNGNNDVLIKVVAENGKEREYHINIIKSEKNEKTIIFEKMEIVGYEIDFSKEKSSYDLKIDNNTKNLDIKVYPNNVTLDVSNNEELKKGSKVLIKIVDDEKEYNYEINILKDDSLPNIFCYSIFAIGVIVLATSITIFFIKKRKKD